MRFKTETITEVPGDQLAGVMQDARDGVPTPSNVTSSPDGKGTFTVVVFYPADTTVPDPGPTPGAAAVAPAEPPDDPAPFAAFAASVGTTFWPVVDPGPNTRLVSYHPSPDKTIGNIGRCFFDDRPGRHHVGVDLFANEGDPVVACADGTIVSFYKFYNSRGRDTFALVIAHDGVVINYGEVAPSSLQEFGLKIGDSVKAGQTIGRIGATGMLHFETYEPGTKQNIPWMDNQPRPLQLQNPTQLLFSLAATGTGSAAGQGPSAPSTPAGPQQIAWGGVVSAAFKAQVIDISSALGCDPSYLMAAMAFESEETFSASIKNPRSGAIGLIQFMPDTAQSLGTTSSALANMTAEAQLTFVQKYLQPFRGEMRSLSDVYMTILWPKAVGKPDATVIFSAPSIQYQQNRSLDVNNDGHITKGEAASLVQNELDKGLGGARRG